MALISTEKSITEIRIPPQNVEAEMSALGSLMLDKDAIYKVVDSLVVRDFYKPVHQEIYEAMLDLFNRREPIDVLSVTTRLREKNKLEEVGGSSYLASLINLVPTATHVAHYASIVRRKRLLRDLIDASHHIAQLGYREAEDVEEIIDEAEQKIFGVAKDSLRQEFVAVREALEEAWERIDRLHKGDGVLRGVTTGFPDLDNYLGGLQKSDFIILASRPSVGKTSLALNFAKNVARGEKKAVGIFSLEMSREQLIDRMIASEANVDLWRLRTGRLRDEGPENDFTRVRDAMEVLNDLPIYIDDSPSPTPTEIRAKARRLQAEKDLGLVVIDYLQLIRGPERTESRVQEVSEISRSLKAMAKELNVPVLAVSQLSRGVEMRHPAIPKLSDLRESGCLAGDTLIMRADTGERITIKDLVGKKDIPVFTLNDRWRLEIQKISKVFSSGRKQLFDLKTASGRTIKASANHPFFTIGGWKRLDTLEIGEYVAIPRSLTPIEPPSSLSDNELILLAHLISNGCVLPHQPIHCTSADRANIRIVAETARRLFGISPRIVPQENWFHVYLPSPYRLTRGKYHPITLWFRKLGIESVRSHSKKLPGALFTANEERIKLFLHHLWSTDGNISWRKLPGRKIAGEIYYTTNSRELAEQIQHLILRLGIWSSLRSSPKGSYGPNYQVCIEGSVNQLAFCEKIGSFGERGRIVPELKKALQEIKPNHNTDAIPKEAWRLNVEPAKDAMGWGWREVADGINTAYCGSTLMKHGLSRERMTRVANAPKSDALFAIAGSDIYWDEIVSVIPLGVEEVFDATVPGMHNFVANDFIVHNSLEQDADVVMFIYREDKDKKNTDRKNIAEILVEKHRNGPTGKVELYFHDETASFRSIAKHFEESL